MSAQPSEHDSHDVIRLGGETAVVVPMHEYHMLKALRDRASAEQVEEDDGRQPRCGSALADDPAPPRAFLRGAYRRLRVGPYRVLYEVEGDPITIVRIDRV